MPTSAVVVGIQRHKCPSDPMNCRNLAIEIPAARETTVASGFSFLPASSITMSTWWGLTPNIRISAISAASSMELSALTPAFSRNFILSWLRLYPHNSKCFASGFLARPPIIAPPIVPQPMQQTVVSILTSHDVQFLPKYLHKKRGHAIAQPLASVMETKVVAKPFRALRLAPGRGLRPLPGQPPASDTPPESAECGLIWPEGRSLKPQRCFCG